MLVEDMTAERAKEIMDQALDKAIEYLSNNKPEIAEILTKQILKCDPEHLSALQILGLSKYKMDRYIEAVEIFQTALEIDATNADNYNNIALAYAALDYRDRALENMKKALELKPNALFFNNIALQYRLAGRYDLAVEHIEKAIEIDPNCIQIYVNLGGLYGEMMQLDKSIEALEKAIEINPDYPPAHIDLAAANQLKGNWQKGFQEAEWRFDYFDQLQFYVHIYDQNKRWNGNDSLEGKRLLVYCEQGFGDNIMFARFLPELKKRGAHIIAHCGGKIESLMKRIEGVDETTCVDIVENPKPELPEYDYQCPLMSLPHLLGIYNYSGKPYITPEIKDFRKSLDERYDEPYKVGLVWAGSVAHPHDAKRSIHLKYFKPLFDLEGIKFFSLQFDLNPHAYGQMPTRRHPLADTKIINYNEDCNDIVKLIDLTPLSKDFNDTANILAGLDLLICCDTATTHLAGAMGVPCWTLLPYNPDWRWGLEGDETIWYDSVRFFRQTENRSWPEVIERVKNAIILQN